mmetsp:Transcript_23382/g.32006  ORF Transcript_23382/g.32006 Transcript_23382/m.32006 type:complete len:312 (-) Transcript_23382:602-1537(-)
MKNYENNNQEELYRLTIKPKPFRTAFPGPSLQTTLPALTSKSNQKKPSLNVQDIEAVDAETGEPLSLTHATWNPLEGRVNMDARAILSTGTGMISISKTKRKVVDSLPKEDIANPLVQEYSKNGPLNIVFNKNWNPRTNSLTLNSVENDQCNTMSVKSSTTMDSSQSLSSSLSYLSSTSNILVDDKAWKALQDKVFNELYEMASQLEKNKLLTNEKYVRGGLDEVKTNCRALSRLKVKYLKDLMQAIEDESLKEKNRRELEKLSADKPKKLKVLRILHDQERAKAKLYIEALQTDSEVVFIRKLSDLGYLW